MNPTNQSHNHSLNCKTYYTSIRKSRVICKSLYEHKLSRILHESVINKYVSVTILLAFNMCQLKLLTVKAHKRLFKNTLFTRYQDHKLVKCQHPKHIRADYSTTLRAQSNNLHQTINKSLRKK